MNLAHSLASLPPAERAKYLAGLSNAEAAEILFDWRTWARPDQIAPPGDWRTWLILAGRGYGKTRIGAELVRERVASGEWKRIALIGESVADVRDVMIRGESGLLACYPPGQAPRYIESKRKLEWPNGAIATTYSGIEPDQLRGPQHDGFWADELAKWQYPTEAWDNLQFGLRLGNNPNGVVTTTPKPIPIIRDLIKNPSTVVTRGNTFANAANLPAKTLAEFRRKYEGTRLGRQELFAEILDDAPGALWLREWFDRLRMSRLPVEMRRIVVAIDPAVSAQEHSDETGIGAAALGEDGHYYVLADRSCRASPDAWARRAISLYHELGANAIVAEVNNGGDMIAATIRACDNSVPVIEVRATRGKSVRAEPIAALYEQGKVHHIGTFGDLEDQMCLMTTNEYLGSGSPDRVDWLVWALTELSGNCIGHLGLVEYLKEEQGRLDGAKLLTLGGHVHGGREMVKVDIADNAMRCKQCDSVCMRQVGESWHCNQCGLDVGQAFKLPERLRRSDMAKGMRR